MDIVVSPEQHLYVPEIPLSIQSFATMLRIVVNIVRYFFPLRPFFFSPAPPNAAALSFASLSFLLA